MAGQRNYIEEKHSKSFATWQAPLIEGPITSKIDDSRPKPPTAGEMQSLQKEAYSEGFELGRKEGHDKGHQEGIRSG